jgi:hypothetical protein
MYRNEVMHLKFIPVVIPAGASTSGVLPYNGQILGITMPATYTGTSLVLSNSVDYKTETTGTSDPTATYQPIYTNASGSAVAYSIPVAAGHYVIVPVTDSFGWATVKFTNNATEGAARTIIVTVGAA